MEIQNIESLSVRVRKLSEAMSALLVILLFVISFISISLGDKETIVVFGGNGFVGRKICQEGIKRGYRVIAITRSGCKEEWKSTDWAQKTIWYKADALNINTYSDYLSEQEPIAIFTMLGTLSPYKQITLSPEQIFEYSGQSNINVCKVASKIKSVKKFVYIGADVKNIGVNPSKANDSYALWTRFMIGQYNGKLATEKCIDDNFGDNAISFRPGAMAGSERINIFGTIYEFDRVPYYKKFGNFYKMILPTLFSADELAEDALDFVQEKKKTKGFHCPAHSKQGIKAADSPFWIGVKQNVDNLLLALISVGAIFGVYGLMKCCKCV